VDDAFKLQIGKLIPDMMNKIGDSCVNDRSIGLFIVISEMSRKEDVP
jgi:hypothetical protein